MQTISNKRSHRNTGKHPEVPLSYYLYDWPLDDRVRVSDSLTLYREYRRTLRRIIREAVKLDAETQNNNNPDVRRNIPNRKARKVSKTISKVRHNTTVSKRRRKKKRR